MRVAGASCARSRWTVRTSIWSRSPSGPGGSSPSPRTTWTSSMRAVGVREVRSGVGKGRTVAVGTDPVDIAVDTRTGRAFVVNRGSNSVSVLDEQDRTAPRTLLLGVHPQAVAVDERTGHVIIATAG